VASALSFLPWLVTLSRHKELTIAWSFLNAYYIVPRLRRKECGPDNPNACADASRLSRVLLWVSAAVYAVGFLVAFVIGPILSRLDRA